MIVSENFLAKLFKTSSKEIRKYCSKQLKEKINFEYLNGIKKDLIVIKIINRILVDRQIIASRGRTKKWNAGWQEALNLYKKKKEASSLIPKFYTARENKIFRLNGELIKVKKSDFEVKMVNIFRNWYFKKYFSKVENIYDFGSGTGHNMVELSKIYSDKNLFASDFVYSAVKLLKIVAKKNKMKMKCFKFDMAKPNKKLIIRKNSAIYTSGALEQLSGNIFNFINFILSKKPEVVVHVEPEPSFYNKSKLVDYLGDLFHRKRGYTDNLLLYLLKLEKNNKIKILKKFKSPFGSLMIEGYNFIVWRPIKK